ncbi:hypothetical protein CP967_31290 [Streptomyces nitrosporeus]|uniref:Uncharacterized protein n=1 Tax=Streptomyces nitrosporeus TaxID=28894 RepID=A0A5J6FKG1_9ACTN|nr:hypothetical protein [Streptomyces nitrosporeus]QEU75854.1 hypothetical protein CP967_31290 [Streptomyces nitrosporeus]GGY88833.1 hypothetical protein GCM10010327_19460 [Streptomyces nitrosporeus]
MSDEEVSAEVYDLREELTEAHRQRAFQREEDAGRIEALRAEVRRLSRALRLSEAKVGGAKLHVDQVNTRLAMLEDVVTACDDLLGERDRYRLAWLSARRRAAEEAVLGAEAVEHLRDEIARLRAALARTADPR